MLLKIISDIPAGFALGDEVEVPEDEALRLIASRWAVPAPAPMERAVKAPVETRKRKK